MVENNLSIFQERVLMARKIVNAEFTILKQRAKKAIDELNKENLCNLLSEAKTSYITQQETSFFALSSIFTLGAIPLVKWAKSRNIIPDENMITNDNAKSVLREFLSNKNYGDDAYSLKYAIIARMLDLPQGWDEKEYRINWDDVDKRKIVFFKAEARNVANLGYHRVTKKLINMVINTLDLALENTEKSQHSLPGLKK